MSLCAKCTLTCCDDTDDKDCTGCYPDYSDTQSRDFIAFWLDFKKDSTIAGCLVEAQIGSSEVALGKLWACHVDASIHIMASRFTRTDMSTWEDDLDHASKFSEIWSYYDELSQKYNWKHQIAEEKLTTNLNGQICVRLTVRKYSEAARIMNDQIYELLKTDACSSLMA